MGAELKKCEWTGNIFPRWSFLFGLWTENKRVRRKPAACFQYQVKLPCSLEVAIHGGVVTWHQFLENCQCNQSFINITRENNRQRNIRSIMKSDRWQVRYPLEHSAFYIQNDFWVSVKFTYLLKTNGFMLVSSTVEWISMAIQLQRPIGQEKWLFKVGWLANVFPLSHPLDELKNVLWPVSPLPGVPDPFLFPFFSYNNIKLYKS